jgi:mannitol/fructose-specific phosphotransferase system IIA component (Ntr-type)
MSIDPRAVVAEGAKLAPDVQVGAFAVIGPEKAAGEHLKCLARIGRLLRDDAVRERLQRVTSSEDALSIVREVDG